MIIYATQDYYTNTYLQGRTAIVSVAFPYYARSATMLIKQYTGTNIDELDISDEVKMCCCELAEQVYSFETKSNVNVTSERVGDYSVSYENGENAQSAYETKTQDIIYKWLAGTGLLYRGL